MHITTTTRTAPSRFTRRRRRTLIAPVVAGIVATGGAVAMSSGNAAAIVEGDTTAISETPWQVALQDSDGQFCGGSIVDALTILTAAHCTEGIDAADINVRAGVANLHDETGQQRDVSRIISHPDGFGGAADVALLVLSEPLELNASVKPIALATAADIATAGRGVVSGWGDQGEHGPAGTADLLSASVPIIGDAACVTQLDGDGIDADRELCAEGEGAGSCYGDSGGPLAVIGQDGTPKLAGVVSWGIECGVGPGVFAEVPAFADWIEQGIAAGATDQDHPSGEADQNGGSDAPDDDWDDDWDGGEFDWDWDDDEYEYEYDDWDWDDDDEYEYDDWDWDWDDDWDDGGEFDDWDWDDGGEFDDWDWDDNWDVWDTDDAGDHEQDASDDRS